MEIKDLERLTDIKKKSRGDIPDAMNLAYTMSRLIKDPDKAYRRFLAARVVFGEAPQISQIFLEKAAVLGHAVAKEILQTRGLIEAAKTAELVLAEIEKSIEEQIAPFAGGRDFGLF